MSEKKVPIRQCTACREGKPKRELVRVVRSPQGEIAVDLTGRRNGRGAYLCRDVNCLERAKKQRSLERAFSCAISEDIYARLRAEIEDSADGE